jgi:ABC-type multidrug transport system fused ATPase/permease subunit
MGYMGWAGGAGMGNFGGGGGGGGNARRAALERLGKRKPDLKKLWPLIWLMMKPRLWVLAGGLALTAVKVLASLTIPQISKRLIDSVLNVKPPHPERLPGIVVIVFSATLVQATSSYALTQLLSKEGQRLIADLRARVQRHVGLLPVSYYDANSTGTLVARIMSDVEGVRNLIGTGLVEFAGSILTAVLALIVLLHRSVTVTLTVLVIVTTFACFLQFAFKRIRPIFRERGRINAEVSGRLTESLGGVRVIKGYHAEEREAGVFERGLERLLQNVIKSMTMTSLLSSASATVTGIVSVIVIFLGGHLVLGAHWTVGDYFQYNLYLAFMISPVFQIVNIGTQLTEALAGLDRTNELLCELEENQDPRREVPMPPIDGRVRFDQVGFAYEVDKPVLHGVSFDAAPGTVTALVGSSGSGKSTIISLLCAFHTPSSGSVTVDGIDLATVELGSFRSQLGVVLQDSFLFDGSIRENIMFSRPSATEAEFLFACRTARVDEFAERFTDTYDTIVGERGVKLSGGQRQRLSIARALLAQPRILILDEATSSLDSESEAMIQAGLNQLMRGRTTFVIAHRLSTIRRADQILVIEAGQIIERGTHRQLYALRGRYYELYTRQHGLEENLFLAPGEGDLDDEDERTASPAKEAQMEAILAAPDAV